MEEKVGRNDPCPCGSGKKYKACCMKAPAATGKKPFKAKVIGNTGQKTSFDLMERTYGNAIASTFKPVKQEEKQAEEPHSDKEGFPQSPFG